MPEFLVFVVLALALLVWLIKISSNGGRTEWHLAELTSRVYLHSVR
jgi:hypothetical protein